jgi:hypothetical protein
VVAGVLFGTLMFLFWGVATEFYDMASTLAIVAAGTALYTAFVLAVNVWLYRKRWNAPERLDQ